MGKKEEARLSLRQDFRDNFVVGFSSDYVTGVWVGNADGTPMHTSSGIDGAGPIWQGVMRVLHEKVPQDFTYTSERKEIQICRLPWQTYPKCTETITEFLTDLEIEKLESDNQYLSPKLEIAFPSDGDIFHPDSSILIKVRNSKEGDKISFYLDGKPTNSIISSLDSGIHNIAIDDGKERDEIKIFVENKY